MPKPFVPGERSYHLDAARMLLMGLGIPYHVALQFQDGVGLLGSDDAWSIIGYLATFIHLFRMPAFFLVSGYLAAAVLSNTDGRSWIKSRYLALGIPLLFGLLALRPIETVGLALLTGGDITRAALKVHLGHLWFLVALVMMLPFGIVANRFVKSANHVDTPMIAIAACLMMMISVACAGLATSIIMGSNIHGKGIIATIVGGLFQGLPYFGIGMIFMHRHDVACKLTLYSPAANMALMGATIIYLFVVHRYAEGVSITVMAGVLALPVTTGILLFCSRRFYRKSAMVEITTKSAFTVYLVHHPIVVILSAIFARLPTPWYVDFALICSLTWAASFGIWMTVRNMPLMNVLLGAVAPRRKALAYAVR